MVEGLAWERISQELGVGIENWFVAGSSPSEWEALQPRARNASTTFIVVSAYDLNEEFLCDSRSEVVPLNQTVKDLWHSRADWHFAKRVLSQYPLKYVRILFPTLGRSDGVHGWSSRKTRRLAEALGGNRVRSWPYRSLWRWPDEGAGAG